MSKNIEVFEQREQLNQKEDVKPKKGKFDVKKHKKKLSDAEKKQQSDETLKQIELERLERELEKKDKKEEKMRNKFLETIHEYETLNNVEIKLAGEEYTYSFKNFTKDGKNKETDNLALEVKDKKVSISSGRIKARFKLETSRTGLKFNVEMPLEDILFGGAKKTLIKLTNNTFGGTIEWYKKHEKLDKKSKKPENPPRKQVKITKIKKHIEKTGKKYVIIENPSLTAFVIDHPKQDKQIHLSTANGLSWRSIEIKKGKISKENQGLSTEETIELLNKSIEV